jgi:uncharacterized membrane protein HdeD (DUF308 family)
MAMPWRSLFWDGGIKMDCGPDNAGMSTPDSRTGQRSAQANTDLLQKGILITLIGLAVLLSPYIIKSPELQAIVAASSLVGWFALVLGLALIGRYVLQRRSGR